MVETDDEFTRAEWDMLVPSWRWMNDYTLVADSGERPVVLTTSNGVDLLTWRTPSVLEPLTPETPVARLIAAAPELRAALKNVLRAASGPHANADDFDDAMEDAAELLNRLEAPDED